MERGTSSESAWRGIRFLVLSMSVTLARKRLSPWNVPRVGDVVAGKYRVLNVLGQGGLAVVLAAMHEQLDERVALKLLLPEWSDNADVVARFLHEGRASIKIHSEHVVRVFDVGETDTGAPYIVMEYLDGSDLAKVLAMKGALPIQTAVDHIAQACEAIAEAHALSIIHRDLKPANLFLTHRADGSACVKVLDFGISKIGTRHSRTMAMTNPSLVMGSPHYMSPEQLLSTGSADERSDVWALGACLHELLAGQPPFHGDTAPELCAHVMVDAPPRLSSLRSDVPAGLEATVLVALEKEPARRFSNVGELAKAIASHGSAVALASAERSMRVLELAGTARSPEGGFRLDAPVAHPMEVTRSSGIDLDDGYRVRKKHPVLLGAFVVALVAGLGLGATLLKDLSFFDSARAAAESPAPSASAAPSQDIPAAARPAPAISASVVATASAAPPPQTTANARRPLVQLPAPAAPPPAATATATPIPTAESADLFDERK